MVDMTQDLPLVAAAYSERLTRRHNSKLSEIWDLLDQITDPEIPVLSIWDLGVLTQVEKQQQYLMISITPTYSGCPAMDTIADDISSVLLAAGYPNFSVKRVLSPAWNTDLMSPEGKAKLQQYGIAPPLLNESCSSGQCLKIACPHCGSLNTRTISEFGSTACKALYQCQDCHEPFDYFKNI